jgi:hypothetical protein
VSIAAALRSTSEPRRPRGPKTASREIFRNRRASQGRSAAYRFVASRENAYAYEKSRQDRQSLQTDPIGYAGGMNLYRCVLNDPINLIDPLGLDEDDLVIPGFRPLSPMETFDGRSATQVLARGKLLSFRPSPRPPIKREKRNRRQCTPAAQYATQLNSQLGPAATGDLSERSTIASGVGSNWTHGDVWVGPPDGTHVTGTGSDTVIPGNARFFDFHTHTLGRDVDLFLSQKDMLQSNDYRRDFGNAYLGPYLGTHAGLFGPPWTSLGQVPVGGGRTEEMFSGTPVNCPPAPGG